MGVLKKKALIVVKVKAIFLMILAEQTADILTSLTGASIPFIYFQQVLLADGMLTKVIGKDSLYYN